MPINGRVWVCLDLREGIELTVVACLAWRVAFEEEIRFTVVVL